MTEFSYNPDNGSITLGDGTVLGFDDPEAFSIISDAWLRVGWHVKHVYSFSWMGRPLIQLPEDMLRIQEVIYEIKPDVIIETGVAHGGSLMFYASLCTSIGRGRVIGIDIDIRRHNREEIENHRLNPLITLIEGSSTDQTIVKTVADKIGKSEVVLVLLDSNHSRDHVLAELQAYAPLVSMGSFIVVCDGIMEDVVGAPRTEEDWTWNNPLSAIKEFLDSNAEFDSVEPSWTFNEGSNLRRVTYWPRAFLRRTNVLTM